MYNAPYNIEVYTEIMVNQPISQACQLFPRDIGMFLSKNRRDVFCCFAEYFQISHDRILRSYIFTKLLVRHRSNILLNSPDGLQDILKTGRIRPDRHIQGFLKWCF